MFLFVSFGWKEKKNFAAFFVVVVSYCFVFYFIYLSFNETKWKIEAYTHEIAIYAQLPFVAFNCGDIIFVCVFRTKSNCLLSLFARVWPKKIKKCVNWFWCRRLLIRSPFSTVETFNAHHFIKFKLIRTGSCHWILYTYMPKICSENNFRNRKFIRKWNSNRSMIVMLAKQHCCSYQSNAHISHTDSRRWKRFECTIECWTMLKNVQRRPPAHRPTAGTNTELNETMHACNCLMLNFFKVKYFVNPCWLWQLIRWFFFIR